MSNKILYSMLNPNLIPSAREQHLIIKDAASFYNYEVGFYNVEDPDSVVGNTWLNWKIGNLKDYSGFVFYSSKQFDWSNKKSVSTLLRILESNLIILFASEKIIITNPSEFEKILNINLINNFSLTNKNYFTKFQFSIKSTL
jgi:hypothetical protein